MTPSPKPLVVGAALLVVYLVWGSTYLAIRVTVRQADPVVSMGARFVAASLVVGLLVAGAKGWRALRVTRRELLGCGLLGLLLPLLGNALVAVGEAHGAPSGITALLIAMTPIMITIYRAAAGDLPERRTVIGLALGVVGVGWLVVGGSASATAPLGPSLLILFACACWGFGSWIQPRLSLPSNAFVMTVYEMGTGGVMMLALGYAAGEHLTPTSYSATTWLAWTYLVLIGSAVAFSAYVWLLSNAPISLVSTYAFVNPVVAVVLGALILDEKITAAVVVGGGVIVVAVAIVISANRPRPIELEELIEDEPALAD